MVPDNSKKVTEAETNKLLNQSNNEPSGQKETSQPSSETSLSI